MPGPRPSWARAHGTAFLLSAAVGTEHGAEEATRRLHEPRHREFEPTRVICELASADGI